MTNLALRIALLAMSLAAAQNGKSDLPVQAIPFFTVLDNSASYGGKEITVNGLYHRVIHGYILTGQSCTKKSL